MTARMQTLTEIARHSAIVATFAPTFASPNVGADVQLHCTSSISNYPDLIKAAAGPRAHHHFGGGASPSGSVTLNQSLSFRREITPVVLYQVPG